ncbi:MAG: hypothetical protein KJZ74_11540 [Gemmatimonadales bacterium]|nr:hypothetical protein [Gemmatimonadota bacterium]MCL4214542.1 hypothetical protein [Gemmatimonadales bacterium]
MILPSRARLARLVAALLLAVHAATVGALPLLDAGSAEAPVAAHWEDQADQTCPPAHDAAACRTCQLLGADRVLTAVRGVPAVLASAGRIGGEGRVRAPAAAAPIGSGAPRAPPAG